MQFNPTSLIENIPNEILGTIGTHLSFQDLNRLAITSKVGEIWANSAFDMLAKELLCQGKTAEERKLDLAKLYRDLPYFIRSLHDDIDKLKDKVFENGNIIIEFDEDSHTPCFLTDYASRMLDQVLGCEEIAKEYEENIKLVNGCSRLDMIDYYYPANTKSCGLIGAGSTGIKIRQTPSNHISNVVSPKLIEALKKASEIFFLKLCSGFKIANLETDKLVFKDKLEKYKNKCAFVMYEKDAGNLKLEFSHCAIGWFLRESKLSGKVDFLYNNILTGVYGEKEDIEKFITILHAQQSPNISMATLKQARGITDQ